MSEDSTKHLEWLEWYVNDAVGEGNEKEADFMKIADQLWESQKKFNEDVIGKEIEELTEEERNKWLKHYISGIQEEAVEIQRRFGMKEHRLDRAEKSMENAKLEMIDTFKYLLSVMQLVDMGPEEFVEKYTEKSKVVEQRWEQKKNRLTKDEKVAGIDLDNVIANYTESLIDFINNRSDIDKHYDYSDHTDYKVHRALDMSREDYNEIKYDYRDSGSIAEMPIINGAREALENLKEKGYKIVLLTSRKKDMHNRIYGDTIQWLEDNSIPYDWIIWSTDHQGDKYQALVNDVYPATINFFVEDKASNANELAYNGLDVYLMDFPYNKGKIKYDNVKRVSGWDEIMEDIT